MIPYWPFYAEGHMFCFIDINDFTYVDLKGRTRKGGGAAPNPFFGRSADKRQS